MLFMVKSHDKLKLINESLTIKCFYQIIFVTINFSINFFMMITSKLNANELNQDN